MSVYKRGKIWWVKVWYSGKPICRSAFTTNKREAESFEQRLREQYNRIRRDGKPRYTYAQGSEKFMNEYLPSLKPSSQKRYLVSMLPLNHHFGDLYLDEVNKSRIGEYVSYRKENGTGNTGIRRDLACLSSMISFLVGKDWLENNPVKNFDKRSIKESPPRTRYLSSQEYEILLESASEWLKPLIIFAVETGLRFEEQFSLEWKNVDLKKKEVFIEKNKTDSPRTVPLSREAQIQIRIQQRFIKSPYVFNLPSGKRVNRLTRPFETAIKNANKALTESKKSWQIEDLRWHDLRRTCLDAAKGCGYIYG